MAIETKKITIDGVEYYTNVSTDGKYIEGGFPFGLYEDAIDPVSEGRVFTETEYYPPSEEFPEWERGKVYNTGDQVTHNQKRYISRINRNTYEPQDLNIGWRKV